MLPILLLAVTVILSSCNSDMQDSVKDAIDVADGVQRKPIDVSQLGVNAFFNDPRFGSIAAQFNEIGGTLNRRSVRLLFAWNDDVQPSPSSEPNFSFYDAILDALPGDMDALVLLTGTPSWMANPATWSEENPRATFVTQWVRRTVRRYRGQAGIKGWQIWNEPNMSSRTDNQIMGFDTPELYLEMLAGASNAVQELAPDQLVVSAATTAINQNFPGTLKYNEALVAGGLEQFVDIFAIHYYGRQFENVVRPDGVGDFVRGLQRRVWITESGAQGVDEQLAYGEQVWPFLNEEFGNIDRIYIYQAFEPTAPESSYGLRNLSSVSDLYLLLDN